ncbi:DUF3168 domain-containing protein [Arsenicitalea aurantiaca]|nr:DUF3168 domain-containing protein [Arsenicitalea aurantiaca]
MSHPIMALQESLVSGLGADAGLVALTGENGVFDAPPRGRKPPYVAIDRHDVLARDGDLAPGHEHRVTLHVWAGSPDRAAALAIVERILSVAFSADLGGETLRVTHRRQERTETAIDRATGLARAVLVLRFFSEPR